VRGSSRPRSTDGRTLAAVPQAASGGKSSFLNVTNRVILPFPSPVEARPPLASLSQASPPRAIGASEVPRLSDRPPLPPRAPGLELPSDPAPAPASTWTLIADHRGEGAANRVAALRASGERVEVSSTLRDTLERLVHDRPTVVVVDPLAGAGAAELEALDAARQGEPRSALLVIVAPSDPVPAALAGLRATERGPWDVVRRDATDDELAMRVAQLRLQIEAQRETERLRHLATHDDRTDLLRPQVFQDLLRQHFSASHRHRLNLGLLLIDLDDFGIINKKHNHTVGDAVITRVGNAIRSSLRAEDIAGRVGGDEFCVLLPYTRKVDAARVVQRLLEHIRDVSGSVPTASEPVRVTASIGFETFSGSDLESVERLRLNAEEALRAAKRAGGDRGVYYRNLDSIRLESQDE
jgi:diguanylate cyclase (GGDEF)-like protein